MKFENKSREAAESGRKHEFFKVLWEGNIDPKNIQIDLRASGSTMKRTEESESILEAAWRSNLAKGVKAWPNDRNPSRYRLAGFEQFTGKNGEQGMRIALDPSISYRDASSAMSSEFRAFIDAKGEEGSDYEPNAAAVSVVVLSRDAQGNQHMMVTLRNSKTDYKPGGFHASLGGYMEIKKETNPVDAAFREITEETGIKSDELRNVALTGLVNNPSQPHPDFVFVAETDLTPAEIAARTHDDENKVLFIPVDRKKLQQWLLAAVHAPVTPALAAIIMVGKSLVKSQLDDAGNPIDPERWEKEMLNALAWRYVDPMSAEGERLEKRDVGRLKKIAGIDTE